MKPPIKRGRLKNQLPSMTVTEMLDSKEDWITAIAAAKKEGVVLQTILNRIREGKIKSHLLYGRIMVSLGKIEGDK